VLRLDHLAVAAERLEEGTAAVEAALGVALSPGGRHAMMSTHNRLLSLGPAEYLEVIAIDPDAPPPGRPRWFDLDRFAGRPRPTTWICATGDIAAEAARISGAGRVHALSRGEFQWRMAIPDDGRLPFDGLFPALIQWDGSAHPAPRLPDRGCRLHRLILSHPDPQGLRAALPMSDARLVVEPGAPALRAEIATPHGLRVLA
jgi:hypothetical protein